MTAARLRRLAAARSKSAQELVRDAGDQYLEREEKREQILREATVAQDDNQKTGMHVTAEEAKAWLDRLAPGKDCDPPEPHR